MFAITLLHETDLQNLGVRLQASPDTAMPGHCQWHSTQRLKLSSPSYSSALVLQKPKRSSVRRRAQSGRISDYSGPLESFLLESAQCKTISSALAAYPEQPRIRNFNDGLVISLDKAVLVIESWNIHVVKARLVLYDSQHALLLGHRSSALLTKEAISPRTDHSSSCRKRECFHLFAFPPSGKSADIPWDSPAWKSSWMLLTGEIVFVE